MLLSAVGPRGEAVGNLREPWGVLGETRVLRGVLDYLPPCIIELPPAHLQASNTLSSFHEGMLGQSSLADGVYEHIGSPNSGPTERV